MDFANRIDIKNLFFRTGVPIVGCIAAAIATVYMMQEVNPLAASCICASAVFFVAASVSPRAGFVALLFLCAYSDLLKRMLVFWGDLSFEQVSYVLAGAPVVVAGLAVCVVTRWAFHRLHLGLRELLILAAIVLAMSLNFLLSYRAGAGVLEAFKQAANNGLYLVLAPVALKLIESPAQIGKFLLTARWMFIPVAAYGIFQAIFGLADFEIEYLRSGLTIMVKELWDARPRPFSTLNSAHALGTLAAAFAVLSLYPLLVDRGERAVVTEKIKSVGLFLLYLAASLASLARTAIIVWVVGLFAFWCFRSRWRTKAFYWTSGAIFAALLAASPYILEHIAEWDPANDQQSAIVGQALRIQTYVERLRGFVNLTRSTDMYSLFGLPEDQKATETTYNHDPISSLLVDFGLVGLAAAVAVVFFGLRAIHSRLLAFPPGENRDTIVLLTAINVGWLASHLLFHGVITTFPVNAFFWLFIGMIGFLLLAPPAPAAEDSSAADTAASRLGLPAPFASTRPRLAVPRR